MIGGGVECGPNAVLALAREGYDWRTIRVPELVGSLTYGGFLKLAARYWRPVRAKCIARFPKPPSSARFSDSSRYP